MSIDLTDITDKALHDALEILIKKYKDNEYVYGRLTNYIEHSLPTSLNNAIEIQKQREERKQQLNTDRDEFTTRFLHKNNYFYCQQTEIFLKYDGTHFVVYSEDDIQHQILTTISSEKCLREWKHKVNKNIIKRIKERSPLHAIPESATIQYVINMLCPAVFPYRNHVKYFLTIIGEGLLAKTDIKIDGSMENKHGTFNPPTYIVSPNLTEIIREIGNKAYIYCGLANLGNNIKYKYHDHAYKDCRLLFIENEHTLPRKKIMVPNNLGKYMIDVLCVAAYYVSKYGSADRFLQNCSETKLVEHALFLSKNTQEGIVNMFIEKSFTLSTTSTINTKNMFFIWKKFLDEKAIPNIIFYEPLKTILKERLKYDEENDCFIGITSIHLPLVVNFMKFWEETIVETDGMVANDNGVANDTMPPEETLTHMMLDYELEIDELCCLFKGWSTIGKNVNDSLILELIRHFYPDVVITDNKYMFNLKSKLWNKRAEVLTSLEQFKLDCKKNELLTAVSIYDTYKFYSDNSTRNKYNLLVSKHYFEKCVNRELIEHIHMEGGVIMSTWWK